MPVESPEDLYGLPLEQFIPQRAALAKALRSEKRRDEAKEVAALRKPSVAAWAVNQLVRTQGQELKGLFQAGDDLVAAQTAAAEGRRAGDAMRDASRRQREAVTTLLQAAEGLLSSEGQPLSQTTLERVGDTLRAAAIDEEARQQVQAACLTHELRFVGLGLSGRSAAPPKPSKPSQSSKPPQPSTPQKPSKPPKPPKSSKASQPKQPAAEAERQETRRRQEAEAERQRKAALKAARQAETDARRTATRAEKELAAAQAHHTEAAAALTDAESRLNAAEAKAQQAATELRNAARAVQKLETNSSGGNG